MFELAQVRTAAMANELETMALHMRDLSKSCRALKPQNMAALQVFRLNNGSRRWLR